MAKRRKKRRIRFIRTLIVLLVPISLIGLISFIYLKLNPLHLKARDVVVEYKEKFDPRDNIQFVFGGSKEDVQIEGSIDTNVKGEYPVTYVYGKDKVTALINVRDSKAPEIALQDIHIDMAENADLSQLIKEAEDAGKITYEYNYDKEHFDERGKHTVEVIATDEDGNSTTQSAMIIREEDKKAPILENGDEPIELRQGDELTVDLLSVNDDYDPSPTITIDPDFSSAKTGERTVKVTVEDRSGNKKVYEQAVKVIKDPAYKKKVVYLTFDDGPSENTEEILDILDKYDVKATFFVTGNHPEYNDMLERAYEEGHSIGLHSYSHDYATVYSSVDAYFEDLEKISDMVKDVTGEESKLIRFPGGSSNLISANYTEGIMSELTEMVQEEGYKYFDWNVDSSDASGNNVSVDQLVENSTASEEQYINLLLHDTAAKDTTIKALPKIIKYYKNKGYIFLGLDSNSYAPHHKVVN